MKGKRGDIINSEFYLFGRLHALNVLANDCRLACRDMKWNIEAAQIAAMQETIKSMWRERTED